MKEQQRFLDTIDFSRVEVQFQPGERQGFLDTIDFSRVVCQFRPREQNAEILGYHGL